MVEINRLLELALKARENACAAYSNFKVGAALEATSGKIYTGCNIENASYGLTVCAERVALWKALSEGEREFIRIIVASESDRPAPPCGPCRQLLWEYGRNLEVVLANTKGRVVTRRLADLLPEPFDQTYL